MQSLKKIWKVKTPYVSKEGAQGLLNYKYAAADYSLLYIYAWSPMAEFVVKYTPPYVAYVFP